MCPHEVPRRRCGRRQADTQRIVGFGKSGVWRGGARETGRPLRSSDLVWISVDGLSDYHPIVIPVFHSYLASLSCEPKNDTADIEIFHNLSLLGLFVLTHASEAQFSDPCSGCVQSMGNIKFWGGPPLTSFPSRCGTVVQKCVHEHPDFIEILEDTLREKLSPSYQAPQKRSQKMWVDPLINHGFLRKIYYEWGIGIHDLHQIARIPL